MSTRSRSTASTDAARKKEKKRSGKFGKASEEPILEVVERRRGSLVSERQDTMKGVLESHDTLVSKQASTSLSTFLYFSGPRAISFGEVCGHDPVRSQGMLPYPLECSSSTDLSPSYAGGQRGHHSCME